MRHRAGAGLEFDRSLHFRCSAGKGLPAPAPAANGVISGSVNADHGDVRAFRVRAKDTVHLISYTVFTNKAQYHIYNLPPSTYEVQVRETGTERLLIMYLRTRSQQMSSDLK